MKVHQIGGRGLDSNIYLIIDEIIVLIDAGTGRNFDVVERKLKELDLKPSDIELLINTHCHFDHSGGDLDFVKAGCELAAHELEAELLRSGDSNVTLAGLFGEVFEPVEVARELKKGDKIWLGEATLRVLHTPGHTAGSISLFEPDKQLLFSGDTIFGYGVGRVDLPTGDKEALLNSVKHLTELRIQKMFPGHGPVVDENAQDRMNKIIEMLSDVR